LKRLLIALFLLTALIVPSKGDVTHANEAPTVILPGQVVTGELNPSKMSVSYSITLPSSGHLELDLEYDELDLSLELHQDGKLIDLPITYRGTRSVSQGALEAGTYEITIQNDYFWDEEKRSYRLVPTFTPANNHEMEPNQQVSNSSLLPLNKWQTGFLSSQDKIDTYQIDLKKAGTLDIMFDSLVDTGTTVELINRDNKLIATDFLFTEESLRLKADLEPGNYYLRVFNHDFLDGSGGLYNVKANLKYANNVEKESNNTKRLAKTFPFFKQQTGFLAWNDNIDYYKFTLPKSSRVSFDLIAPSNAWSVLGLMNSKGEFLLYTNLNSSERFRQSQTLAKGTYYVAIERSTLDTMGGSYKLQINSTHLYPVSSINKVTVKSSSVSGKTEKGASVTMTIGNKNYHRKADSKGNYSFKINKQKAGTVIKITAKNKYGSTVKTTKVTK